MSNVLDPEGQGWLRLRLRDFGLRLGAWLRWPLRHYLPRRKHAVPGRLIVSLTSYPPRFPTLARTLKTLLSQSIMPDAVVLWVAGDDFALLPEDVLALCGAGLAIETCADLRSYKKIIPALEKWPDAFIATADDDSCYWRTWLEELVCEVHPSRLEVLCHRAHKVVLDESGQPVPYPEWTIDIAGEPASQLVFPTGVGGVLYPPGSLHRTTAEQGKFLALCPTADDVWLYFMAHLAGAKARKVPSSTKVHSWLDSQDVTLFSLNVGKGLNDVQMAKMIREFGFPGKA